MKIRSVVAAAGLSVLVLATPVRAASIVNGGFEIAGFSGWSTSGDATQVGTLQGYIPFGSSQAQVSNGSGSSDILTLESFLGVSAGALDNGSLFGATEGSAIRQTVAGVQAGDVLTFSWAFLTQEGLLSLGLADHAFMLVDTQLFVLSTALDPLSGLAGSPYVFGTPRTSGSFTFLTGGTHTIAFGVVDIDDTEFDSALLLDTVALQSVPEPGSLLLLGTGLVAAARLRPRRR